MVFRSKLTMHTAYDRKDNAEPASITALAVSKDHKTLYVGDARGRIFSWSVTEQPGRGMADHWLKDEGADQCVGCRVRYDIQEQFSLSDVSLISLNFQYFIDSRCTSVSTTVVTVGKCFATNAVVSNRKYPDFVY